MALFDSTSANQQSAVREWARKNGENPNLSYDDLNAAEKAEVDAIIKRNKEAQDRANREGNGGINISLPFPNVGLNLTIPCPRPGILPNPAPQKIPESQETPDLPGTNNPSTNGGTNRVPDSTNSNPIVRTNPGSVTTNPGSTNRGTNGNGRNGGINPRAGFTGP